MARMQDSPGKSRPVQTQVNGEQQHKGRSGPRRLRCILITAATLDLWRAGAKDFSKLLNLHRQPLPTNNRSCSCVDGLGSEVQWWASCAALNVPRIENRAEKPLRASIPKTTFSKFNVRMRRRIATEVMEERGFFSGVLYEVGQRTVFRLRRSTAPWC